MNGTRWTTVALAACGVGFGFVAAERTAAAQVIEARTLTYTQPAAASVFDVPHHVVGDGAATTGTDSSGTVDATPASWRGGRGWYGGGWYGGGWYAGYRGWGGGWGRPYYGGWSYSAYRPWYGAGYGYGWYGSSYAYHSYRPAYAWGYGYRPYYGGFYGYGGPYAGWSYAGYAPAYSYAYVPTYSYAYAGPAVVYGFGGSVYGGGCW